MPAPSSRPEPEPGGEPVPPRQEETGPSGQWTDGHLATNVTSYLLAGPLAFGGGGWLIDRYLMDAPWLIPVGVLGGLALSVYVIWLRYGTQ